MGNENIHDDDWMEEAPLLASLRGNLPADEVPDGYFERLPILMMDRIRDLSAGREEDDSPANSDSKVLRARPAFRRVFWGLAASVILMIAAGILFLNPWRETGDADFEQEIQGQLTSLTNEQILDQLYMGNVTEEDLFGALGQEGQAAFGEELHGIGQGQLLDYLEGLDLDAADFHGIEFNAEFLNGTEL